jgi:MYXO-CTERM domain-containing protein
MSSWHILDDMKKLALASSLPLLALSASLLAPVEADACGGTFCDTGPTSMPVDQTGENILFHIGENSVEAHIQIQYDPDSGASQFAWVIPVTALPEFEVGSQLFFDAVLAGSVPTYGNTTTADFCGDDDGFNGADEAGDDGTGTGDPAGDGDGDNGNPEVVYQATVGAFEIAVLDGGTVEGVMTWLGANGYEQDPAAEPILASYLEDEFLFVAMKLSNQAGIDEIHPIVIRYEGTEACVPIRLTRIAASEDMDIRAFFLGQARTVPLNYRHVLVNPLKLDWFNFAANYKEVITMAVDAEQADGNAFVTEYAGPSNVIQSATFFNPAWDEAPIAALGTSPVGIYEVLQGQGLIFCDPEWDTQCTFGNPLLGPLFAEYIPVPAAVDPTSFYECLSCFEAQIDITAWNAAEFATKFQERVIAPAENALALVENNPYLTRMYTTISPAEMNDDPMFRENANLSDVSTNQQSTQTLHCDGSTTVVLPDGRQVYFPAGADLVWPDFGDEMPWEEDVGKANMADDAPLVVLVDNTDRINELLAAHNEEKGGPDGVDDGLDELGNCACNVDGRNAAGGLLFGFMTLGLFGMIRRRR